MEKVESPEHFFKRIETFLIFVIILGSLLCSLIGKNLMWGIAFLSGGVLGFLNFRSTKKEGITFIRRVQESFKLRKGSSIDKERNLFIFKLFLKLIATGIIIFVLIAKFHFHPVIILLSFFTIYAVIILISLKFLILDKISI